MKRRKVITAPGVATKYESGGYMSVLCSQCNRLMKRVADDSDPNGCICWYCVQLMVPYEDPKTLREKYKDYPTGWKHMLEFVAADGTVYERGVENVSLKGKLPITDITNIVLLKNRKHPVKKKRKKEKIKSRLQRMRDLEAEAREYNKQKKESNK